MPKYESQVNKERAIGSKNIIAPDFNPGKTNGVSKNKEPSARRILMAIYCSLNLIKN